MTIYEMLDAVRGLPAGDYAEAGVWQGWMAEKIAAGMNLNSFFWLFDTFEGHPDEPGEFDLEQYHPKGRYSDTFAGRVRDKMKEVNRCCAIVQGRVQDTLSWSLPSAFRFVNIDLDHYEPTKVAASFFKSRMVPGGIIRFDDYNHPETPGATKAIDEVFGRENVLPEDFHWIA